MLRWYCLIQILGGLSSHYHEHILAKQVTYFQALLAREKELVATKGKKNTLLQLMQKMDLEHKRSRLRSFVSIIVLKICLSCLHLFTFVILAGPHLAMSHFLIIENLFCFMSVLGSSKFPQNQQSLWHNDVGK